MVPLWNVLPDKMKSGNQTYDTLKKRLKKYFIDKFVSQVDRPQYSRKCSSAYRFKLLSFYYIKFTFLHYPRIFEIFCIL